MDSGCLPTNDRLGEVIMTETVYALQKTSPDFGLPPRLYYVVDGMRQAVSAELIRKHGLDVGDEIIVRKKTVAKGGL